VKTGILINARLGSKRLPDKHLQSIGKGTALAHLIIRLVPLAANRKDIRIFIATGSEQENAPLQAIAQAAGIELFYGDADNIPLRHHQLVQRFGLAAIVSVDGDDLLSSPTACQAIIDALENGAPLARTEGLPFGMNAWGYTAKTLAEAINSLSTNTMLETGWGRIFSQFTPTVITYSISNSDAVRATLDYPEDLEFFRAVFTKCPTDILKDDRALTAWIYAEGIYKLSSSRHEEYWNNFTQEKAKEDRQLNENYSKRLHAVIPGGAHTYSRGDDQYPANAPAILERGKGAYSWSPAGEKFLDYGMALRAVNIGYAEPCINEAAIRQIEKGNNLTRASTIELEAAELLVSLIDSVDMVKFTKNGSTATSAAVKLARAYTGRDLIARCAQHPFFSYDDWFIGSTAIPKGIPRNIIEQTKSFNYNDIVSLEKLIAEYPDQFACVIMEPVSLECPISPGNPQAQGFGDLKAKYPKGSTNFLKEVEVLCKKHGIIFILDEMITGFRWGLKGAQEFFGLDPDISTFGKAMANGFSVAGVAGKRDIMKLGSTDTPGTERVFLLSTTHGAEMSGLGAFVETVKFMQREKVIEHFWDYGQKIVALMETCALEAGIGNHFKMIGTAIIPAFVFLDESNTASLPLRTLFLQELIKAGILMPWISFTYRHGEAELALTRQGVLKAMEVVKKALTDGVDRYLAGPAVKPVFRRFN